MAAAPSMKTMADMLGVGNMRLWCAVERCVEVARAPEGHGDATNVGGDGTTARRGHDCITPFYDLSVPRPFFVCAGRDEEMTDGFADD